ncbi:unnamed protein product [Bathycoccus prasinos]
MGFVLRKNAPNDATTTTRTTQKKCQRCFSLEHWTFECLLKPGDQGTYVKRQSKTELLKKRREEEDNSGKSNTNKGFQEFMKIGKKERREVFRDPRERRARALKRKVDALRGTKKRKKKKKSGRGSSSSSSSSSSSESSGSSSSSSSGSSSSSSSSLSASSSSSSLSISSGSSSLSSSGSSSSSS